MDRVHIVRQYCEAILHTALLYFISVQTDASYLLRQILHTSKKLLMVVSSPLAAFPSSRNSPLPE